MYQIIHSAKVVKCDETGDVGILVDGKVLPVGGNAGAPGGGSNKIIIRETYGYDEETGEDIHTLECDVSYDDARRILMEDQTAMSWIKSESYDGMQHFEVYHSYRVSLPIEPDEETGDYFNARLTYGSQPNEFSIRWSRDRGVEAMPE